MKVWILTLIISHGSFGATQTNDWYEYEKDGIFHDKEFCELALRTVESVNTSTKVMTWACIENDVLTQQENEK